MLCSGFEPVISTLLEGALHYVDLEGVSCFLAEEYLFLDLDWIS